VLVETADGQLLIKFTFEQLQHRVAMASEAAYKAGFAAGAKITAEALKIGGS